MTASIPCASCISSGKSDICTNNEATQVTEYSSKPTTTNNNNKKSTANKGSKRGYKSHVPSACINCKIAHLACDVSRPCKRCVSLNKTDTCQDMQHKKRGRPKLREKPAYSSNEHTYEILYGTIQTPTITMRNRSIIPSQQVPPFKSKTTSHSPKKRSSSVISFIHEPIESFQQQQVEQTPISVDATTAQGLTIETVIPSISLSTSPPLSFISQPLPLTPQQQPMITETISPYTPTSINSFVPVVSNSVFQPTADSPSLSIILSMEVCCAKVSDETIKCWGYYPQELAHRSLYDFISSKDTDRLARLHRLLIDNSIEVMKASCPVDQDTLALPPTERTTSALFSNANHQSLCTIANGSRSFSDTIHIKKRTGEYELYEVIVYIGGGLGADLYNVSSLSKQYIVAQFKKHEYEVKTRSSTVAPTITIQPQEFSNLLQEEDLYTLQPFAVFSPISPSPPTSPPNNTKSPKTITKNRLSSIQKFAPQTSSYKPSNTTSPKFNIAPITSKNVTSPSPLLSRFSSPSAGFGSTSLISSPACIRMRNTGSVTVTHPTQQYFLQTSSSTLNAAASAAQNKSRHTVTPGGPTAETTVVPDRKIEMSIRSLLC
ncbi:uncharacterized protein B0P05DRAFT_583541 [Gilbertella persicaria]|uniref:uncharacterized protein n=1 Tax=Gilbertella persicaria TaxID=101096 RepID=UPI00221FEA9D|nr:uncharacterized protein B0P05DRAFT_583541 [Gilbertella persicaria]KAI8092280.1 hypothetical protein B0P05DRAFT_583541 [Gilbertella persicaria]